MRNLAAEVPEDMWPEVKARIQAVYQTPSRVEARDLAKGVIVDYGKELHSAGACFRDDSEASIAQLRIPVTHRRAFRTNNRLECLVVEQRRRLRIIPNTWGERPEDLDAECTAADTAKSASQQARLTTEISGSFRT